MPSKSSRPRQKAARASHYRQLLLEAAERVFAESGYDSAKMSEIAGHAEVSLATVYRFFDGKWELFRAVHDLRGQQMMAMAMRHVGSAQRSTPLRAVLDGVASYVHFLADHPDYLRMHLREGGAWASGGVMRSQEQVDLWNGGIAITANLFAAAIAGGEMLAEDPPQLMVKTMIAMHQVRLAEWVEASDPVSVASLVTAVQRQLLRAFCPPEVATPHLERLSAQVLTPGSPTEDPH